MEFEFKLKNSTGSIVYAINRAISGNEVLGIVKQSLITLRIEPKEEEFDLSRSGGKAFEEEEEEEEEIEIEEETDGDNSWMPFSSNDGEHFTGFDFADPKFDCSTLDQEIKEKILSIDSNEFVVTPVSFDKEERMPIITVLRSVANFTVKDARDMVNGVMPMGVISKEQAAKLYYEWRNMGVIVSARTAEHRSASQQIRTFAALQAERSMNDLDDTASAVIMSGETDSESATNEEMVP